MFEWIMEHTKKTAVFAGPMPTMANLLLSTGDFYGTSLSWDGRLFLHQVILRDIPPFPRKILNPENNLANKPKVKVGKCMIRDHICKNSQYFEVYFIRSADCKPPSLRGCGGAGADQEGVLHLLQAPAQRRL